jgi:hypothetical protein
MFRFPRTPFVSAGVIIAALMLNGGIAFGQGANIVMPGCRSFIDSFLSGSQQDVFYQGFCSGVLGATVELHPNICVPQGVVRRELARVVIQYIDSRPARIHEAFGDLAVEALRAAWPCNR